MDLAHKETSSMNTVFVSSLARPICSLAALMLISGSTFAADDDLWVVYEGAEGPGKGKHIVWVSGDEEYRSEEALPMMARILAFRYGFKCTVLFAIDPETGVIDPNNQTNIPGLAALDDADLMVMALRFRELPDSEMKHIVDFVKAGKPVIGLRTSTHAFNYSRAKVDDEVLDGTQVGAVHRIDEDRPLRGRHLDQGEARIVGALADELGIEGEEPLLADLARQRLDLIPSAEVGDLAAFTHAVPVRSFAVGLVEDRLRLGGVHALRPARRARRPRSADEAELPAS